MSTILHSSEALGSKSGVVTLPQVSRLQKIGHYISKIMADTGRYYAGYQDVPSHALDPEFKDIINEPN